MRFNFTFVAVALFGAQAIARPVAADPQDITPLIERDILHQRGLETDFAKKAGKKIAKEAAKKAGKAALKEAGEQLLEEGFEAFMGNALNPLER